MAILLNIETGKKETVPDDLVQRYVESGKYEAYAINSLAAC